MQLTKTRTKTYAKKQKTPQQARETLMWVASRAEKSSGDARRLMRGWGLEKEDAEKVLEELVELKFIDDQRFASAYVREKLKFSGWGAKKISAHLALKGVAREVISAALEEHVEPDSQAERLEKLLTRRKPKTKAASDYEMRSKLIRYALGQGFDYDSIRNAVDKIFRNDD